MHLKTIILSIVLAVSNPILAQPAGEGDPLAPPNLIERVNRCELTLEKCGMAWMQQNMAIGMLQDSLSIQEAQIKDLNTALVDARKKSFFERPEIIIPLSVILGFGAGALIAK